MVQNYDLGTKAWQPDSTEGWVASELVDKTIEGAKAKLVFQLENGEVRRAPLPLIIVRPLTDIM